MCESAAGSLSPTVVEFPVLAPPASIAGTRAVVPSLSPPARVSAPTTTTQGANAMSDELLRQLSNSQRHSYPRTVTTSGEDTGALLVHGLAYEITDPSQDRSQVWVTHTTAVVDGRCEVDYDWNMTADEAEELARQLVQAAFLARMHNQLHRDELRAEAAAVANLTSAG